MPRGACWLPRQTTGGGSQHVDAAPAQSDDGVCFVLTNAGLTYRSLDQGATWIAVGTVSQVGMTAFTPHANELVAVNREGLVARSTDGAAWTWVGTVNQLNVVALANDTPQTIGVPETPPEITMRLLLAPPRPNPLRSGEIVTLEFSLPHDDVVTAELLDVRGRLVESRPLEAFPAADRIAIRWNTDDLPSGVYFLRLSARSLGSASRRLVVLD